MYFINFMRYKRKDHFKIRIYYLPYMIGKDVGLLDERSGA